MRLWYHRFSLHFVAVGQSTFVAYSAAAMHAISRLLIVSGIISTCYGAVHITQAKEALGSKILHEYNLPCKDLASNDYLPCSVSSEGGYLHAVTGRQVMVDATSPANPVQLIPRCSDGSMVMTCVPLQMSPRRYFCGCNSKITSYNDQIKWDAEWGNMDPPEIGLKRSLYLNNSWSFFFKRPGLTYLLMSTFQSDSQINASSYYDHTFSPKFVRLDKTGGYCAWMKKISDSAAWISIDLLQPYKGLGLVVRQRCGNYLNTQYMATAHVSVSDDGITYAYVVQDIELTYTDTSSTYWFPQAVTARYWKIHPVTWVFQSSFKADIIGFI